MNKHEIYKQYDEVFDNKKIKHIKKQFGKVNNTINKLEKTHAERLKQFSIYCGVFIKEDICRVSEDLRITKEKGIEVKNEWGNKNWRSISNDYSIENTIEKVIPFLSDEGKQVYKEIESLNPTLLIERKVFNVGGVNKYHKQYFYLPSYVGKRTGYPINLILKKQYSQIALSIPAFHRYPILSKWGNSDAQSLKRQMLLVEFYDGIKKHILPIVKGHIKQLKWIEDNNDKIIERLAKYEVLVKI